MKKEKDMRNIFNFLYEPESDLLVVNMYTKNYHILYHWVIRCMRVGQYIRVPLGSSPD